MNDVCPNCGRGVVSGQAKIAVAFTTNELADIAYSCPNANVRARVLCAMTLLDEEYADAIAADLRKAGL